MQIICIKNSYKRRFTNYHFSPLMVKAMDCGIVGQFRINTLGERYEPPYLPRYGLNSIIALIGIILR